MIFLLNLNVKKYFNNYSRLFSQRLSSFLIASIRFYQRKISVQTAPRCKYLPTCSEYAIQSIGSWGIFRGTILAVYRILRCHPLAKQRVDEVPINKLKKRDEKEMKINGK